jgi:hypothetical protein
MGNMLGERATSKRFLEKFRILERACSRFSGLSPKRGDGDGEKDKGFDCEAGSGWA